METPSFSRYLRLILADMGKMDAGGMIDTNSMPLERFSDGLAPRLAC